jgi:hypothetical protein
MYSIFRFYLHTFVFLRSLEFASCYLDPVSVYSNRWGITHGHMEGYIYIRISGHDFARYILGRSVVYNVVRSGMVIWVTCSSRPGV